MNADITGDAFGERDVTIECGLFFKKYVCLSKRMGCILMMINQGGVERRD